VKFGQNVLWSKPIISDILKGITPGLNFWILEGHCEIVIESILLKRTTVMHSIFSFRQLEGRMQQGMKTLKAAANMHFFGQRVLAEKILKPLGYSVASKL
jgi:hypothetical protein